MRCFVALVAFGLLLCTPIQGFGFGMTPASRLAPLRLGCGGNVVDGRGMRPTRIRVALIRSSSGGDPEGEDRGHVESDWRAFRNKLILQQRGAASAPDSSPEKDETSRSRQGSSWAHELVAAEDGCVLLSNMEHQFSQRYFESAVITLVEHGKNGTVGMITNRPMTQTVGEVAPRLHEFKDCPLFFGGPVGDGVQVLHRVGGIRGSREVVAGLYYGADMDHASQAVRQGLCKPSDFRFFYKYSAWSPGQLDDELVNGVWFPAACSSDVALPLARPALIHTRTVVEEWRSILRLLGGKYADLSERARMQHELTRGAKVDRWAEAVRKGEVEGGAMLLSMGDGSSYMVEEWLDDRAQKVRSLLPGGASEGGGWAWPGGGGQGGGLPVLRVMNRVLFDDDPEDGSAIALSGDDTDYYNPDNSRIDQVISRGKGNPITMCAIYMAVGRRLGLKIEGVNAPAHFMCRLPNGGEGGQDAYIDPFRGGQIMTPGEARQVIVDMLTRGDMQSAAMDKALVMQDPRAILQAAPSPAIWSRMAHNLVRALLKRGDGDGAMEMNIALDHLEEACQRVLKEVGGATTEDLAKLPLNGAGDLP